MDRTIVRLCCLPLSGDGENRWNWWQINASRDRFPIPRGDAMGLDQFGVFSPLFTSDPGYLALLNLSSHQANQVVFSVAECCRKSTDPYQGIGRLLDEPNWRFHIVAAVVLSVLGYDEPTFIKLWAAFD